MNGHPGEKNGFWCVDEQIDRRPQPILQRSVNHLEWRFNDTNP